jgi:transcriptional regulator with XRE-family HTH domain
MRGTPGALEQPNNSVYMQYYIMIINDIYTIMPAKPIPSLSAGAELAKLGADIAIARKHRRFTQQRLADGAGVNVATIRRLERGDGGISLGVLVMVLLTLGESGRLGNLFDVARDDIGLVLGIKALPQRVRTKGQGKVGPQSRDGSTRQQEPEPEAF